MDLGSFVVLVYFYKVYVLKIQFIDMVMFEVQCVDFVIWERDFDEWKMLYYVMNGRVSFVILRLDFGIREDIFYDFFFFMCLFIYFIFSYELKQNVSFVRNRKVLGLCVWIFSFQRCELKLSFIYISYLFIDILI